jgi:hypothetical protein
VKALLVVIVGIFTFLCVGGVALATGVMQLPSTALQTNIQASPPLQPLNAQVANAPDMTVTLSERYMNLQMTKSMTNSAESNPQIDLHANNLADVSSTVRAGFLTVRPKASVSFAVQNGRVVISVLRVDVGGFGVPSSLIEPQINSLKQNAETELNKQFANLQTTSGLKLQSLSTTENSLTLNFSQ